MVITQSNIDNTQRLLGRIRPRLSESRILASQYQGSAESMFAIEIERFLRNATASLVVPYFAFELFLSRIELRFPA